MAFTGSIPALAAVFAPARVALAPAVTGDAVTDALDAAELLDVDMDHLAWGFLFIADDFGLGVKRGQLAETTGLSDPGCGGARQADRGCNLPERLTDAPQSLDLDAMVTRRPGLQSARATGAVRKARFPLADIPGEPFIDGRGRDANGQRDLAGRRAGLPARDNQGSHFRSGLGVLVNVHGLSPEERVASQTPQSTVSACEQPVETLQLDV